MRSYSGEIVNPTARSTGVAFGAGIIDRAGVSAVIEGGPGTGKTSYCRRNALDDAAALVEGRSKRVPIFVPLHELAGVGDETFEEVFLARVGRTITVPKRFHASPEKRFYLDGVDEIADRRQRSAVLGLAREGGQDVNVQLVITVRDYLREPSLQGLPRLSLAGLTKEDLRNLARLWCGGAGGLADQFMEQIAKNPELAEVAKAPLMATVMILVFRHIGRIPENRAKLYSVFVNLLCGGWDLAKGVVRPTQFTVDHKLAIASALGWELHRTRERAFPIAWYRTQNARLGIHAGHGTPEDLLEELVRDGVMTRTGPNFEFAHLSYQEFFAARHILGDPDTRRRNQALRAFDRGDQWWREVLLFYIGLSGNPQALLRWFRSVRVSQGSILRKAVAEAFPNFTPGGEQRETPKPLKRP